MQPQASQQQRMSPVGRRRPTETDAVVGKTCLAKRPGAMMTQQSAPPSQASPFPRLPVLFVPVLFVPVLLGRNVRGSSAAGLVAAAAPAAGFLLLGCRCRS
jgi:hypothetical protein